MPDRQHVSETIDPHPLTELCFRWLPMRQAFAVAVQLVDNNAAMVQLMNARDREFANEQDCAEWLYGVAVQLKSAGQA